MIGFAVNLERRKISCTKVCTEMSFCIACSPNTCNDSACICEDIRVAVIARGFRKLLHTLHSSKTCIGIEVVVNCVKFALFVHGPVGVTIGRKEEGCGIPSVFKSETEFFIVLFASSDNLFEAISILFGDDACIVIQVIAIITGHRICPKLTCNGCSSNGACVIIFLDGLGCVLTGCYESSSLNESGELVLCEAVNIRSGCNVSNYLRACISFGNAFNLRVDHDAFVFCFKSIDLLLCKSRNAVFFGNPKSNVVSANEFVNIHVELFFLSASGKACNDHDNCQNK